MTVMAPVELPGMSQAGPQQKDITRLIVATSIGNALEWYDIAIYGYFAVYISKAFFPNNDPTTSLLLTFGTFGLSFLVRPIGGVVLGAYADRHGRKASLMISIVMMTFGTLAIALMPAYETIGILAPIAVLAPVWCRVSRPAANSEARRRFWSSIGRTSAASLQAGNLPARA
jgi:MFS transporter, MHS family, proline/betaine transporter